MIAKELSDKKDVYLINNKEVVEGNLDRAFLRAEITLVQHKLTKADVYISGKNLKSAVYALEAAGRHLLYSQIWSSNKLAQEDVEIIKSTREKMLLFIEEETWERQQILATRNLLMNLLKKM